MSASNELLPNHPIEDRHNKVIYETPDGKIRAVKKQMWAVPDDVEFGPAHNECEPRRGSQHPPPTPLPSVSDLERAPDRSATHDRTPDTQPQSTSHN